MEIDIENDYMLMMFYSFVIVIVLILIFNTVNIIDHYNKNINTY